jgi:hypothetical protein
MNMNTTTISLDLGTTTVRDPQSKATRGTIDWSKIKPNVIKAILETGARTILNNTYNGGGAKATDTEKQAKFDKKLAAWERGEFNVTERGESEATLLREALRARLCGAMKVDSVTDGQFRKFLVDSIVAAGGAKPEEGKAIPVDAVVEARAKLGKVDVAEYTTTLLAEGEAIAAARSNAMAEIDVTGIAI